MSAQVNGFGDSVATASTAGRTIPFDYAFRFEGTNNELKGQPGLVHNSTVEISIEAAFTAVSIGYGVIPKVEAITFGLLPVSEGTIFTRAERAGGGEAGRVHVADQDAARAGHAHEHVDEHADRPAAGDEDVVAGPDAGHVDAVQGDGQRLGQRADLVGQALRQARQAVLGPDDVLRVGAGRAHAHDQAVLAQRPLAGQAGAAAPAGGDGVGRDAVADRQAPHAVADLDDLAGRLVSHHERRDAAPGVAGVAVQVRAADADRVHAHQHLVGAAHLGPRLLDEGQVPLAIHEQRAVLRLRGHHAPTRPRFQPPSTDSVWPVMYSPASDTSRSTVPAMSSGTLERPSGIERTTSAWRTGSANTASVWCVRTRPGAMPLTRMPSPAHSAASERVSWRTPALETAYGRDVVHGQEVGARGDVEDAPAALLAHQARRGLAGEEHRPDVDVEDEVPVVLRDLVGRLAHGQAGTVDEDVEAAEGGVDVRDQGLHVAWVAHVDGEAARLRAGRAAARWPPPADPRPSAPRAPRPRRPRAGLARCRARCRGSPRPRARRARRGGTAPGRTPCVRRRSSRGRARGPRRRRARPPTARRRRPRRPTRRAARRP